MLLSVEEYEPLLNPFATPLLVDDVLGSDLLEVLSLLLEKFPDLKPSPLFELVESLVVLVEDLLDEPELLKDPELNPLLDFELLELDLLLDLAKAIVLLVGIFMPINDKASNGKLENVNITVRKIVKTYFLVIL